MSQNTRIIKLKPDNFIYGFKNPPHYNFCKTVLTFLSYY
jgi:hypothetical protein